MPNRSALFTLFAVLLVAFVWGYKREDLFAMWTTVTTLGSSSDSEEAVTPGVTEQPVVIEPGQPIAPPVIAQQPPVQPPPPFAAKAAPQQPSLTETLDSIRPAQVQPEQITQRNAYFQKLSQQLKELQGGSPPPAVGQNAPFPPPAPPPDNNVYQNVPPFPGQRPPGNEAPPIEAPQNLPGAGANPSNGFSAGGENVMEPPLGQPLADMDQQTAGVEEDEIDDSEVVDEEPLDDELDELAE